MYAVERQCCQLTSLAPGQNLLAWSLDAWCADVRAGARWGRYGLQRRFRRRIFQTLRQLLRSLSDMGCRIFLEENFDLLHFFICRWTAPGGYAGPCCSFSLESLDQTVESIWSRHSSWFPGAKLLAKRPPDQGYAFKLRKLRYNQTCLFFDERWVPLKVPNRALRNWSHSHAHKGVVLELTMNSKMIKYMRIISKQKCARNFLFACAIVTFFHLFMTPCNSTAIQTAEWPRLTSRQDASLV